MAGVSHEVLPIRTGPELARIAERVAWWLPIEEVLADPFLLIARVMALGSWADVKATREFWGEQAFEAVLDSPPPGLFTQRRWNYWHVRFDRLPVPPLPRRFPS